MNKDIKDITIITVCFNSEKTISKTIESVLAQDFGSLQYIIIDGGSYDNTLNIATSYKKKFAENVMEIYSEKDEGPYDAMNKGLKKAKGKLIGIINSDDWYENDALKTVWNAYSKCNDHKIVIYGAAKYIRENRIERIEFLGHDFLTERPIVHPACFVSKEVYDDIGLFNTKYKIGADWDLLLRALENGIQFIPLYNSILANFRLGGLSGTDNVLEDLMLKYDHDIISEKKYKWKCFKHKLKRLVYNIEVKLSNVKF